MKFSVPAWLNLSTIFLVVSVPLAVIQIWEWIRAPSVSLSAEITYGPFQLPQGLSAALKQSYDATSRDALEKRIEIQKYLDAIEEPSLRDDISRSILSDVSSAVRETVARDLPEEMRYLQGYWSSTLQNDGSIAVETVEFTLPGTVIASVVREGHEPTHGKTGPVLRFEKLAPHETVSVYAWSTSTPTEWDEDKVKLVHASGIGDVSFRVPVAPFWVFMNKYWWIVLLFLFWLALQPFIFSKRSPESTR